MILPMNQLFQRATSPNQAIGFCAGAYGVINTAGERRIGYIGQHSRFQGDPLVLTGDHSLFDVASVTKSVVALLTFYCISHGHLRLEHKVRNFIPGLQPTTSTEPTIRDLLSYAARIHLDQLEKPYTQNDAAELRQLLCNAPVTVGHTLHYSNYAPILLTMILEQVSSWTLQMMVQEIFCNIVGMKNATFDPPHSIDHTVATEIDPLTEGPLCGTVHDEFTRASGLLGAAGLFCTCDDLLRIGQLVLNRGDNDGRQIINESYIDMMAINQFETGSKFGLGFGIWDEFASGFDPMEDAVREIGADFSKGAIFKNGFGSATIAIFPKLDKAIVLQTNCTHLKRHANSQWINKFRYAAIMGALTGQFPEEVETLWH